MVTELRNMYVKFGHYNTDFLWAIVTSYGPYHRYYYRGHKVIETHVNSSDERFELKVACDAGENSDDWW